MAGSWLNWICVEDQGFYFSRDYSHPVLLPDDADLGSVTSRLSKEGLLTIEASRASFVIKGTKRGSLHGT